MHSTNHLNIQMFDIQLKICMAHNLYGSECECILIAFKCEFAEN